MEERADERRGKEREEREDYGANERTGVLCDRKIGEWEWDER